MKIILSRKGFDSTSGGCPSPILPDGRLCSLPIPDKNSPIKYADIAAAGMNLADIVVGLTGDNRRYRHFAHLDPDLRPESLPRQPGWRPLFGQENSAEGHLSKQGIAPGDLFLFFGLFRQTEWINGRLTFVKSEKPKHIIWGWLQVADITPLQSELPSVPDWATYHPHFHGSRSANNKIYVAKHQLDGISEQTDLDGAGVFDFERPELVLTDPLSNSVTGWKLPLSFYPRGAIALTYHQDPNRWALVGDHCTLKSVSRGQEFVLNVEDYPDVRSWAARLLESK